MKIRSLWKRWTAAVASVLMLAPSMLMPLEGTVVLADEYDTTYMVATFSNLEKTYRTSERLDGNLYAEWDYADGASAQQGIDVTRHDFSKLELRMTMTLSSSDPNVDDNVFRGGYIKLRSLDEANKEGDPEAADGNVEHNVGFSVSPLDLKKGDNYISINLADWMENGNISTKGVMDWSAVNRMIVYIDTVPKDQEIVFTMTLADICLVDTTMEDNATPRVATPSEGMTSSDKIVYSVDATQMGADKTGERDSTAAIQRAINKVTDGGVVFLPAGRYKVTGTLQIPGGVTLRGEWLNPDEGGLGKGTILMAYTGKGNTDPTDSPLISMSSAACLRDISVWYPEQNAADPIPYSATIYGDSHTDVINVTLYNSYYGFYNNGCSSMLIRRLYGTVLYRGIHGAYAYDIPRIENVYFDTAYWANSGLEGAPSGEALTTLNQYVEDNLIAILAGEQDWGYWYDLNIRHAKYAILLTAVPDDNYQKLVPGNIAAGKVTTRDVQVGLYMESVGYPGFELTYSDIEADEYGLYFAERPNFEERYPGISNISYYSNATIAISATTFSGGTAGIRTIGVADYGINLNDCVFEDWEEYAVWMNGGHFTSSNGEYSKNSVPLRLESGVKQVILTGNTFASETVVTGGGWSDADPRIRRDDANTSIPHTPEYDYTYVSDVQPSGDAIFNVADYGAVAGSVRNIPQQDSTQAFQQALDAAGVAGGGTVYVPAGVYRLEGALTVPTGVELRGSFESAHYGNGTYRGTQLYVYGSKDNENGAPLITLSEGSGVKGMTVFYPEQGYSDQALIDEEMVHAYPPTVRANEGTWIQNMAMIGTYTAIDAMTNRCDDIVITDVTGAAMYATLIMGHGTDGGVVQNLHFNYSGWTQQGRYENCPNGTITADGVTRRDDLLGDYTTRVTKGLILGDVKNVNFFSCFNIIVAEQIVLMTDPYTGGDFEGTMWGVAFDAATYGVVGEAGCDAELTIVSSMGVFNRQGGGYNVWTKPGFTGTVSLFNADAWDAASNLVYVEGGTVNLVQLFSWCVYRGVCRTGGVLNLYGSTIISNNGDNSGRVPDLTYESGAAGQVIGNLDCKQMLNIVTEEDSYVVKELNGDGVEDAQPQELDKTELKALLDEQRNETELHGYTAQSVAQYNALFAAGWEVYNDPDAQSTEIFAQVTLLRRADDILQRELVAGELMLVQEVLDSDVDHYMSVDYTFETPVDLSRYDSENMTISLDMRVNKDNATFPAELADIPAEQWIQYIVNGSLILWSDDGGTRVDISNIDRQYRLSCGEGQLEDAVVGEYITVTFPVPESIIQAGQIDKLEFYMYNDLHGLLNQVDPAEPPKYSNYDQGVSISVKDIVLQYNAEIEADKSALNEAITAALEVDTDAYTPASVTVFQQALTAAQSIAANTAALQSEVNEATYALEQAQAALVLKANKTALNAAISAAAELTDLSIYTDASVATFNQALEAARQVAADENATQEQADNATQNLTAAQQGLTQKPVANKEALAAAIAAAQARLEDGKTYTPETLVVLNGRLAAAQTLLEETYASQAAVDSAAQALEQAVAALRYLAGDVDGNGEITASDALLALQAATGKVVLNTLEMESANADGQPGISALDALLILQYATHKTAALV